MIGILGITEVTPAPLSVEAPKESDEQADSERAPQVPEVYAGTYHPSLSPKGHVELLRHDRGYRRIGIGVIHPDRMLSVRRIRDHEALLGPSPDGKRAIENIAEQEVENL